jgi:hypothetical protein
MIYGKHRDQYTLSNYVTFIIVHQLRLALDNFKDIVSQDNLDDGNVPFLQFNQQFQVGLP